MDSERIQRIHQRVRKVKTSEEAGVRYVQAWEERYYEREEARNEGIAQGLEQGLEQGLSQGVEKGIRAMVLDYIEEGFDENKILIKLQKRFTLSEQKAKGYYKKFGKSE